MPFFTIIGNVNKYSLPNSNFSFSFILFATLPFRDLVNIVSIMIHSAIAFYLKFYSLQLLPSIFIAPFASLFSFIITQHLLSKSYTLSVYRLIAMKFLKYYDNHHI